MKTRIYVSDVDENLLMGKYKDKKVLDSFGRYFDMKRELEADNFIEENPRNKKYIVETEGKLTVVSLKKCSYV